MRHPRKTFSNLIYVCVVCCVVSVTPSKDVTVLRTGGDSTGYHHDTLCHHNDGKLDVKEKEYSMKNVTYEIFGIGHHTSIAVSITDIDEENIGFLIVQAHSQNRYLILGHELTPTPGNYVNSTSPGLMVHLNSSSNPSYKQTCHVFLTNCHNKNITVLFMVRNYSSDEPIPGNYKAPHNLTQPYLVMEPNILTTKVTYRAASYPDLGHSLADGQLKYETFLAYMYERDLSEKKYWNMLIATSTLQGLRENAKSVAAAENNTAEQLNNWFVSYSGVGAVITVVVSYNNSHGTLYSSAVSYGCDFIEAEEYRCTKLVTPMAKLFCASLLFIGGILLFLGHRWLNFTMFTSGFLFFWCVFFLLCAQGTTSNIIALEWGTLVGALAGGVLWLIGWHKFQRPFHSSLLIIVMAVIFVGMIITYFLRYAIAPKTTNLSAFVVFPVFFAVIIIAYSIVDIKKVHIFSCTLLGSYAFIVPFAFYFGSSLTYIVINVIGLMTVVNYSAAVGYPPFQVCDIILLCLWIILFTCGTAYQLYREKSSPPFHPPNLSSWRATKKFCNFVFDKLFACLPMNPDPGGVDIEDQPMWILRVHYSFRVLYQRVTCSRQDSLESGYESFQRVRTMSQSEDSILDCNDSKFNIIKARVCEWIERLQSWLRRDRERLVQRESEEYEEAQLLDDGVTCCTFRKSQVVLDDEYTDNSQH
nr:transmembrane 7 superfamily member 3-like [Cherax quadricarinatus]